MVKKPTFVAFTGVNMFFLAGARILKPDLRDSLAKPGDGSYSLEILSIGITI